MASMGGQAKGSLFVHSRQYLGDAGWNELLATLATADRDVLSEQLATNLWYPVGLWNRLMQALVTTRGAPTVSALSRHIAAEDVNLLFKMLLKMGSPEFLLRRTEAIWSRYFDVGRFVASELQPQHWRLTLTAATGEEDAPSSIVCTYGVTSWVLEALALTGAHSSRLTHTRCRFHGADVCEWSVHW
jgi:hypothetical protein